MLSLAKYYLELFYLGSMELIINILGMISTEMLVVNIQGFLGIISTEMLVVLVISHGK